MSASGGIVAENANDLPDISVGQTRREGRLISEFIAVARRLWPAKVAYELSARTGLSLRQCERLTAEQTGMSAEAVRGLLISEEGFSFLEALMGDAAPAWWEGFRYQVLAAANHAELMAIRERQKQIRKMRTGLRSPRRT